MSNIYFPPAGYYQKYVDQQPVFSFKIDEADFYINTYGISVSDSNKSFSKIENGKVSVLNRSAQAIFFNTIDLFSVTFRKESFYPVSNLKITLSTTTLDETAGYQYLYYSVKFRSQVIGTLTMRLPIEMQIGSNAIIYPFQSVELAFSYYVLNVNALNVHYWGNSKVNQNTKSGIIDIAFHVKTFKDINLTQAQTEELTVSLNLINTRA